MNLTVRQKSQIRYLLQSPSNYSVKQTDLPESIMFFDNVCKHDTGFMCQCRIDKLIELLEQL